MAGQKDIDKSRGYDKVRSQEPHGPRRSFAVKMVELDIRVCRWTGYDSMMTTKGLRRHIHCECDEYTLFANNIQGHGLKGEQPDHKTH